MQNLVAFILDKTNLPLEEKKLELIIPLYLTLCSISNGSVFRCQRNTSPVGKIDFF